MTVAEQPCPVGPVLTDEPPAPARPPGLEPLPAVWAAGIRNPVQLFLLALIRAYQRSISLALGPVCRFYPSCSRYGFEAIRVHGVMRGSWLTVRRLGRCNPWNAGGVDLVPPHAHPEGATMDADAARPQRGAGTAVVPASVVPTAGLTTAAAGTAVADIAVSDIAVSDTASRGARP